MSALGGRHAHGERRNTREPDVEEASSVPDENGACLPGMRVPRAAPMNLPNLPLPHLSMPKFGGAHPNGDSYAHMRADDWGRFVRSRFHFAGESPSENQHEDTGPRSRSAHRSGRPHASAPNGLMRRHTRSGDELESRTPGEPENETSASASRDTQQMVADDLDSGKPPWMPMSLWAPMAGLSSLSIPSIPLSKHASPPESGPSSPSRPDQLQRARTLPNSSRFHGNPASIIARATGSSLGQDRAPPDDGAEAEGNKVEVEHEPRPLAEATGREEELIVLVHGLQGAVEDFTYFQQQLDASAPALAGSVVVYASDVNTDKTHDGVDTGALRLAADIRRVVAAYPTLKSITIVGFSLGGIYTRYVVGLLFDRETGLVAGLTPHKLITVASPNLGVRSFGVYRFIPMPMMGATRYLFGPTGEQLVLMDSAANPLLMHLTSDLNPQGLAFMSALRAFKTRVMYGNMRQDFMVNWGSAVADANVQGIGGVELQDAIIARAKSYKARPIDHDFDDKGCKIAFTYTYPRTDQPADNATPQNGQPLRSQSPSSASPNEETSAEETESTVPPFEEIMSLRLQAAGWQVIAIDFPLALPIAHNRIMAMSRGPIHTWMNASGRRAVHHLVDTLLDHWDDHEPCFSCVNASRDSNKHIPINMFF